MSPRLEFMTCPVPRQCLTHPSIKGPSPDPRHRLGARGVQPCHSPATPGRAGVPVGVPPMPSRSASAGMLGLRQHGIEHQGDIEDDSYGYKVITHHARSACHLTQAVNSRFSITVSTSRHRPAPDCPRQLWFTAYGWTALGLAVCGRCRPECGSTAGKIEHSRTKIIAIITAVSPTVARQNDRINRPSSDARIKKRGSDKGPRHASLGACQKQYRATTTMATISNKPKTSRPPIDSPRRNPMTCYLRTVDRTWGVRIARFPTTADCQM